MSYLLFIFAFLMRLINLNQSFWLDEATTARVIQQYKHFEILTKFSPFDFHPPLYYLFMKFWSTFFGYSEIALRMPSVIFSILTGYIVYKIVRSLNGYIAGIYATAFFLFNPLIVYYSQEARPYMMAVFLLTASLYYFILNIKNQKSKRQIKNQIYFNLYIFLSLITFYGSVFMVITFLFYFLYKKQYKDLFICLFVVFGYLLLISPLLYQQLINARISLAVVTNWNLVLGKANLKNLFLIPIKFSIGRIDFYPKWIYYLVAGLWTIFIVVQSAKFKVQSYNSKLKVNNLLICLLFIPLLLGFMVSFFTPLLQYFRFIYLIPIFTILLAININDTNIRIIVAGGFLAFSLIYLLIPIFHREDWKTLVKTLPQNQSIYMIKSSSDPVKYYNPRLKIEDLRSLSSLSSLSKKLIIIPYTAEIYGYNYDQVLVSKKYKLSKKTSFRNLYIEKWSKQ